MTKYGYLIDANIDPWIEIYKVEIIKEFIRENWNDRRRKESSRVVYKYVKLLWSFKIPEEFTDKAKKTKINGVQYESGRSRFCLSTEELEQKFNETINSHIKKQRQNIIRMAYSLQYMAEEQKKFYQSIDKVVLDMEDLHNLICPSFTEGTSEN